MRSSRGIGALLGSGVISQVSALGTNLILGWLFLPDDFGTVAAVSGISFVLLAFHEAGLSDHIARQHWTPKMLVWRTAWATAWLTNGLIALFLASFAFSIPMARMSSPYQASLLLVSVTPLAGTAWSLAQARYRSELRLRRLALLRAVADVGRALITVALAYAGSGAVSPFAAQLVVATAMSALLYRGARPSRRIVDRQIDEPPVWKGALRLIGDTRLLIVGALVSGFISRGDYLVLGFALPPAALGIYYFGYQLVAQPSIVASQAIIQGGVPLLASSAAGNGIPYTAFTHLLRISGAASATVVAILAATLPGWEELLWGGRWSKMVPVALALSLPLAFKPVEQIVRTAALAEGKYTVWLRLSVVVAGGSVVGALLVALLNVRTPLGAALVVGCAQLGSASATVSFGLRKAWPSERPSRLLARLLATQTAIVGSGVAFAVFTDIRSPLSSVFYGSLVALLGATTTLAAVDRPAAQGIVRYGRVVFRRK